MYMCEIGMTPSATIHICGMQVAESDEIALLGFHNVLAQQYHIMAGSFQGY
jgi:hypothetical protein